MIYTKLTKIAMKISFEAHKDQTDKSGLPYIFHPFHLAEQMTGEAETVCALLHDVLEDTDTSPEDLKKLGFGDDILEALCLLTHRDSEDYFDYVKRISKNPIAKAVKIADLKHNSDLTRLDVIDEGAIKRNEKYKKALSLLEE